MYNREPAQQHCPWLKKMALAAPPIAAFMSESAKTMFGDFPPSSSETFFRLPAAAWTISLPTSVDPVNATLATSGCSTSGTPTSDPKPVTTFTTPGRKPARSTSFMNSSIDADVYSEGFTTAVLPAARAGANFQAARRSGEFHGTMAATTPSGSHRV